MNPIYLFRPTRSRPIQTVKKSKSQQLKEEKRASPPHLDFDVELLKSQQNIFALQHLAMELTYFEQVEKVKFEPALIPTILAFEPFKETDIFSNSNSWFKHNDDIDTNASFDTKQKQLYPI